MEQISKEEMKEIDNKILGALGIEKIVKTRDVFCSCNSDRVGRYYLNVDEEVGTAYNAKEKKNVSIDQYSEIDIDYCKACGRVDYIRAERGYADSFRMYLKQGTKCACGEDIANGEDYVVVMGATPNGNMIVRCRSCNKDIEFDTRGIFPEGSSLVQWINVIAEPVVNLDELEFIKEQRKTFDRMLGFANDNDIDVHIF